MSFKDFKEYMANGLVPPDPDSTDGVLKSAPQTTNQNSLDTILGDWHVCDDEGFGCVVEDFFVGEQRYARCKLNNDNKLRILAWHHQETTKDMLALIGADAFLPNEEETTTENYWYKKGRNDVRAELRQVIQAREEQ